MAAVAEQRPEKLEIGDVFGATFGVIGRNLVLCLLLGGLLAGLPVALQQYWEFNSFPPNEALAPNTMPTVVDHAWGVAGILISLAIWSVLQAAFVRLVVEDFSGRQPRFGDCLATGFAVVLPATGMSILIGLGVTLGMLLLIVPGIMLALRWFVSVPVLVHERTGPLASMSRSGFLTYGNRWRLLLIQWMVLLPIALVSIILVTLIIKYNSSFSSDNFILILSSTVIVLSVIGSIVLGVLVAVCYVGLRGIKEDIGVDDPAKAFS